MYRLLLLATFACVVLCSAVALSQSKWVPRDRGDDHKTILSIINDRKCPCQCGNYLPGSKKQPACFGCSVGKGDVSRVLEGLEQGRTPVDLMFLLDEPVLVNVFADYTNHAVSAVWERAMRAAEANGMHRVVLRPTCRTENAHRAMTVAESARDQRKFTRMNDALIKHNGPWDTETLVALAEGIGLDGDAVRERMATIDINPMVRKNRQHADQRGIEEFPAVYVNRERVADSEQALTEAIREVLMSDRI